MCTAVCEDYLHLQPVIDSLPGEFGTEEYDEAVRFVREYSHMLSKIESELRLTSQITNRIDTGNARPI